jgi:FAD/FMN-containing dehydrogenase
MLTQQPSVTDELKREFGDKCIVPGDAAYDAARVVFVGGVDKRPAAIVRAKNPGDIAAVVSFAAGRQVELAIRGGGHSGAGHSTTEGGIVLDLRDMTAIEIDPDAGTAWAETGLTAGAFNEAVAKYGLAVGFGDAGSVGIGGITLGGGVGYLVRKHGLTIDSLLAAEVVTADGQLVRTDAEAHPDLFWAIRGGGGNFGVATRLKFRLHALPAFTGGMLILPATPETVAGFVAAAEAAPEALSTIANVMPAPPMPFLPPEAHGKMIIMAMMAFAGPEAEAEAALRPFRALAAPIADMVKPSPYTAMFPPEADYHPTVAINTMYMNRFAAKDGEAVVDRLANSTAPMRVAQIRVLGGAASRVADDATAYAHRTSAIMVNLVAICGSPEDRPVQEAWVADFGAALAQEDRGAYVNFLADEPPARVRAAYPGATWDRLRAIKRRYDPTNLFRLNHNIPPAARAAAGAGA